MFNIKKGGFDESITIYPYKNNVTSRLELQENVIKLALKTASFQQQQQQQHQNENFNFLFVASAHVESDTSLISLIIEQFDKGQKQFTTSQTPSLVPSAPIPDALYIPARLCYQNTLTDIAHSPTKLQQQAAGDDLIGYYINSVKYLTTFFHKFCTSIDSITKIMSLSSSIYFNHVKNAANFNQYNTLLNATFEMITLANYFDAQRIMPMPIIETSLLKTLQTTSNFFLKPKTGYCSLYKNENIILLMDSEPKATKLPLMGIWVSGVQNLNHPLTWAACIRYAFSSLLANKSPDFQSQFVVILFASTSKRPEYYLCKPLNNNLEFTLFSGFSKLVVNKTTNENRCISIDMLEVKDGYNFKLFANSVNQTVRQQDIYGQHLLLTDTSSFNQSKATPLSLQNQQQNQSQQIPNQHYQNNQQFQNHSYQQQQQKHLYPGLQSQQKQEDLAPHQYNDNDLQPRSLSASVNWTNPTGLSSTTDMNKVARSSPVNFAATPLSNTAVTNQYAPNHSSNDNAGNNNVVVGSYHSVSDISVLSDNDIDDSIFSNSLNATTCSSMQNNSNGSQNSSASTSNNNYNYMPTTGSSANKAGCFSTGPNFKANKCTPMVSQSDDFEFLRPKDPPMPTKSNLLASSTSRLEQKMKYNHQVYSSNSLSCSSNGGSVSSLSPSPSPSFNSSASNLHHTTPTSTSDNSNNNNNNSQERTPTNTSQPTTKSANSTSSESASPSAGYASSKSILFGIPRDYAPMPTIPAENYGHTSINSSFVDVTMNNCDDMSLYQPMSKLQLSQQDRQHQRASNLAPLAESDISQQSKSNSTSSDNFSPAPTPTNMLYSSSATNFPRSNSKNLVSASASNISPHYQYQQQQQQQQQQHIQFKHQSFNEIGSYSGNKTSSISPAGSHCTNNNQNSQNQIFSNNSQSGLSNGSKQDDPLSHMDMFNYTPNEIASQLMNNDEQLKSHLVEMKRLQETMYSLEQNSAYKNTSNSKSHNNSNSEMASVGNAICQLSNKIEERKNILKTNLFHSYEMFSRQGGSNLNSLNSSAVNFNTSMEKQRLGAATTPESGSSSEYNSMAYPVVNINNHNSNIQMGNKLMQQNSVNTKNNFVDVQPYGKYTASPQNQFSHEKSDEESENEEEEEDEEDEDGDDVSESENVFGAALKDFKNQLWQQNYQSQCSPTHSSHQQSNNGQHTSRGAVPHNMPLSGASSIYETDQQTILHKFNYVSLLLDDYCDKNTSMNTKALASKYLKDSQSSGNQFNYKNCLSTIKYEAQAHGNSDEFNSCYIPATSSTSSMMLDSTKYDKLFQYYTENPENFSMLEESEQKKLNLIHQSIYMSAYRSGDNASSSANSSKYNQYNSTREPSTNTLKSISTDNNTSGLSGTKNNQNHFIHQNSSNNFSHGNNNNRLNSFENFPPFPSSSSTCNSSAQLTGSQYNNQKQLPTSTPRFNSFENNSNGVINSKHTVQQMSYDTNFNATNSYSKRDETSQERGEDSEDDADSENDTFDKKSKPKSSKNDDDDDDGEIWLFRKKAQPQEKLPQAPDEFAKSLQKLKQRKRQEREKRRNAEGKDFSDQDEPDRDVTTVLDIAKLKRLPKLL